MKRTLRLIAVLSFTSVTIAMWAQSVATAELHVRVGDPTGAPVPNASVVLSSPLLSIERSATCDLDGQCIFLSLRPGEFLISATAEGFSTSGVLHQSLTVGQVLSVSIAVRLPSHSESVSVSAAPAVLEVQRTTASATVNTKSIEALPINGRSYINFALIDSRLSRDNAPLIGAAPTSGLNIHGQRARSNLVNVDGVDAIDVTTNGVRSTVSQEAVQEFHILTSNMSAEHGRATGGVINIVTRSGTDDIHGAAFGYLRNRHLQAVNPFSSTADPAYTRVQAGFSMGGPIRQERTHYFLSSESTRRRETGFSTIGENNFDLVPYNTSPIAPLLGLGGNSYGTILLTAEQAAFVSEMTDGIRGLPSAEQNAVLPLFQKFLNSYLTLAGGGSGIALDGVLPSPMMLPVIAAIGEKYSLPPPSSLNVFPTSGGRLPASFMGLNAVRGNYPVKEATDTFSLRFDHRINDKQSASLRVGFTPGYIAGLQNNQGGANFGQSAWSRSAEQSFHDWTVAAQHTFLFSERAVNEVRFQYAYRGLRYQNARAPGGNNPAISVAGYAFLGREPISYVERTEERLQWSDSLTVVSGHHSPKAGIDIHVLPLSGSYTVQFGGAYTVGAITAGTLLKDDNGNPLERFDLSSVGLGKPTIPGFSPVQAYGLGVPQSFVQGMGNPHQEFTHEVFAGFLQDTWRAQKNLTVNYGVRYDVELTPEFRPLNAATDAAQRAMGIMEGIPRDFDNLAPRIGLGWDPRGEGNTVVRASYGIFFDHPPMALAFDSDVADGAQAPIVVLFGGSPGCSAANRNVLNATNAFQGLLSCLPSMFNYIPAEQRFSTVPNAPSIFVGQQYLTAGVPLLMQPLAMPVARDFQYGYTNQANLAVEQDIGHNFSVALEYDFSGGRHLNRPNDRNGTRSDLLKKNFDRATSAVNALAAAGLPTPLLNQLRPSDPLSVSICPTMLRSFGLPEVGTSENFVPAALVSFFRPSGLNHSLLVPNSPFSICADDANHALNEFGLGRGVEVPFSSLPANYSDGSSVYHGLTARFQKHTGQHYEFLASYTWSHAIDDGSIELQTGMGPQDFYRPDLERANSLFDQRHRFVFSGTFESGKKFKRSIARLLNNWTVAPVVEIASGRPFNIVTYTDRNFDFSVATDRPMVVPAGGTANACGDRVVSSSYSPTGYFQLPCYKEAIPTFTGNLGRNAGVRPWTLFNDVRIAKHVQLNERISLNAITDIFNVINRFNVADVNPLYTSAGTPTATFDPRQFQIALRLKW